jgi:TolA-binding protein
MDEQQHKIWWELHRRVSKGETLSGEDNHIYLAGRDELEAEEWASLPKVAEPLRPLQERLQRLRARNEDLAQQEVTLRRRATELEVRYRALTGEPLGIES